MRPTLPLLILAAVLGMLLHQRAATAAPGPVVSIPWGLAQPAAEKHGTPGDAVSRAPAAASPDAGPVATPAAALPDPGADPAGWARQVYDAVRGGRWAMAAGLLLIGVVWASRRWLGAAWPWLRTDRGGVALALASSLLAGLGSALAAGAAPDGQMLLAALEACATAMAAYVAARKMAGVGT